MSSPSAQHSIARREARLKLPLSHRTSRVKAAGKNPQRTQTENGAGLSESPTPGGILTMAALYCVTVRTIVRSLLDGDAVETGEVGADGVGEGENATVAGIS